MKLKKIASLALAGVMAVSMLAGCATNKPEEKPGEGEGEGSTVTVGYSAKLEDAVNVDSDIVTYADNKDDQTALQKMVDGLSTEGLKAVATSWVTPEDLADAAVWHADVKAAMATLKDDLNVFTQAMDENKFNICMNYYADATHNETNTVGVRAGVVYAVNGGVSTDAVLNAVAKNIKATIKNLPDTSKNGTTSWDYTYTVSASVVNRAQQANYNGTANSTTFVLVTLTRNVTNAKV